VAPTCYRSKGRLESTVMVEEPMYLAFRTGWSLEELARLLGGDVAVSDSENEYEWVIAEIRRKKINISRLHTTAPTETDIHIYMDDDPRAPIPLDLRNHLVASLIDLGIARLSAGSWIYEPGSTRPLQVEHPIIT
jgi:hypothetical protein